MAFVIEPSIFQREETGSKGQVLEFGLSGLWSEVLNRAAIRRLAATQIAV